MNNSEAVLNFVYFTTNHPGMNRVINGVFGEGSHLAKHFTEKLNSITDGAMCCEPKHIIKFLHQLSEDNQLKFIDWVNENYSRKGKN